MERKKNVFHEMGTHSFFVWIDNAIVSAVGINYILV